MAKRVTEFYGTIEEKPVTEQQLFRLQEEFFKARKEYHDALDEWRNAGKTYKKPFNRSLDYWCQMLEIVYSYSQSLIKKDLEKKKEYWEPEKIMDKASAAALIFMNQYRKKEDFYIGGSFAGLLQYKLLEVKNGDREDYHISLNTLIENDRNHDIELEDIVSDIAHNFMYDNDSMTSDVESDLERESLYDKIHEILSEMDAAVGENSQVAFLARLYLLILLRKPRTRHPVSFFVDQWTEDKYQYRQAIESVALELHNRLGGDTPMEDIA